MSNTHPANRASLKSREDLDKIRKLLVDKNPDGAALAIQLLDTLKASEAQWLELFPAELIRTLLAPGDPAIWAKLAESATSRPRLHKAILAAAKASRGSWREFLKSLFLADHPDVMRLAVEALKESYLHLDYLTTLSDAAATALSNYKGTLGLNSLTTLSTSAARSLAKHKGGLSLSRLTTLSDAAAESLAKHKGGLSLSGLTTLSDAAAESLAKHKTEEFSYLQLEALQLTPTIAMELARYQGKQLCFGCQSLELSVAKALAPFKGMLWFGHLKAVSNELAAILTNRTGSVYLGGLKRLDNTKEHLALARYLIQSAGDGLGLHELSSVAPEVIEELCVFNGRSISAPATVLKSLQAARLKKIKAAFKNASVKAPIEWSNGQIVLPKAPAKPLKGRNAERREAVDASWFLPSAVAKWFTAKLVDTHKTRVSSEGIGSGKSAFISPEAAELLYSKAEAWMWLHQEDTAAAKSKVRAEQALVPTAPPAEYRNGKVHLPAPAKPVSKAYCWKPDFAEENYRAVLDYRELLPATHVGTITDKNGYPAKTMSPEAAEFYRQHRDFWVAKHWAPKKAEQAREARVGGLLEKAADKAGMSKQDLEAKLGRLVEVAAQGNMALVASLIAGFEVPWLFESLLAGSEIVDGKPRPGKTLKPFKNQSELVLLLALAYCPDGSVPDASLHKKAAIEVKVTEENIQMLAEIVWPRLPGLKAVVADLSKLNDLTPEAAGLAATHLGPLYFNELKSLSDAAAKALARHRGDLYLTSVTKLSEAAANSLFEQKRELSLGDSTLSDELAVILARHRGVLKLYRLSSLSAKTAKTLAQHDGKLDLGVEQLTKEVAEALALFNGDLACDQLKDISNEVAEALSRHQGNLSLGEVTKLDVVSAGHLAKKKGNLFFKGLAKIETDTATCLTKLHGHLFLGSLDDSFCCCEASSEAIEILAGGLSGGSLALGPLLTDLHLTDAACKALSMFSGDVGFSYFLKFLEISDAGADYLVKRKSWRLLRTKMPKSARRIFEKNGAWDGNVWTRRKP